jgi:uncharacterized protein (TIGR02246 family)
VPIDLDSVASMAKESRQEVERTLAQWSEAVRGGDLETVVEMVTEDAEFWTHGAPALVGREAVRAAFGPVFAGFEMVQDFKLLELVVQGDLAFVRGVETNRLRARDGDASIERTQRAFSVLRRGGDGRWRFARGMTNLPPEEDAR